MKSLKKGMEKTSTFRSQDVMGEALEIKKIHTREMSKLFRSKTEIYRILMIEGQFYLPPLEECTIDYLRDIFSGRKRVSRMPIRFSNLIACQPIFLLAK